MCKISNEQRAHDLALLAVQVELTNTIVTIHSICTKYITKLICYLKKRLIGIFNKYR